MNLTCRRSVTSARKKTAKTCASDNPEMKNTTLQALHRSHISVYTITLYYYSGFCYSENYNFIYIINFSYILVYRFLYRLLGERK